MSSTLKQTFYYGIGLVIMKGVSFFMLPVVARYLSPQAYGSLDVLLTVLNVGSLVIGFGMVEAMYRFYGEGKDDQQRSRIVNTAAIMQIAITVLVFICLVPFGELIRSLLPTEVTQQQWLIVLGTLAISACINIPLSWLRLVDKARDFFIVSTAKAIFQAGLTWYLLQKGLGIDAVLYSSFIATAALATTLTIMQFHQSHGAFDTRYVTKYLKYGLPLVLSGILAFMANGFEKWIIAGHMSTQTLAYYAIAVQFAMMIAFLTEPFTLWWFPKRFVILNAPNGKEQTVFYAQFACQLSFALALVIGLVGPLFIRALLPINYHPAANLLPWLCVGMALKQCSHLLSTGCYSQNSTFVIVKINAATAVFALIAFTVGTINYGMSGIALAFILVNLFRAILYYWSSQKILKLPYKTHQLLASFGLMIAIFLSVQLISSENLKLALVVAICTSLVLVFAKCLRNCNQFKNRRTQDA